MIFMSLIDGMKCAIMFAGKMYVVAGYGDVDNGCAMIYVITIYWSCYCPRN